MRRLFVLLGLLALVVAPVWAMRLAYNADVSVTQANSAVTFTDNGSGGSGAAFNATHILIRSLSTSANTCTWDFHDTTASATLDIKIAPGEAIGLDYDERLGGDGWSGGGAICAAGQTATFRVFATR